MNEKRTTEQFKADAFKKHGHKLEILSEYNGSDKPINIIYHCEKHGNTYKTMNAKNVSSKTFQPCGYCNSDLKSLKAQNNNSTDKNYHYNRLKEHCENKGGRLISTQWITAKTKYEVDCGNPDHPNFFSMGDSILNSGNWCPYCCGRTGDFNTEYKYIIESKNGTMLSEYINATTHIKVKCNKDGHEWDIYPSNIKKGRWCPVCSLPYSEKVVYDYLINNNYKIKMQYGFDDLRGLTNEFLKFDFAILDNNNKLLGLLEIDDEEHRHNPKELRRVKARERDKIKNEYCRNNNINLFRLDYHTKWAREYDYNWYYEYIHNNVSKFLTEIVNIEIA